MTTHNEGRLADLTRNCRCEELKAKLDWVLAERDATFALMLRRANEAEAENERLRLLLTECAEDIRSYVDHEYPEASRAQYPSIERRWIRDMELVWRVRAAVETKGTGDE